MAATTLTPTKHQGGSFLLAPSEPGEIFSPEDFTQEHHAIARTTEEFWNKEVAPNVDAIQHQEPGLAIAILRKSAQLGLTAVILPTDPQAQHGTVAVNPDGSFTYVPDANFNGEDAFYYRVFDGELYSRNPARVKLNIYAVNDPPVAVNDAYSTAEDTGLTIAAPGVLGNDTDVDGDALTAVLVSGPAHGTLALNANGRGNGWAPMLTGPSRVPRSRTTPSKKQ